MKWIQTVAAAGGVVVALGAGAAQAATIDWGAHDAVELGSGLFTTPGGFDDRYDFSLGSGNLLLTAVSNDAPPTFEMSVVPTFTSTAPGPSASNPSSAAVTAANPRLRFTPWSASPIAESSWVRWSAFSFTAAAAAVTQARAASASN